MQTPTLLTHYKNKKEDKYKFLKKKSMFSFLQTELQLFNENFST